MATREYQFLESRVIMHNASTLEPADVRRIQTAKPRLMDRLDLSDMAALELLAKIGWLLIGKKPGLHRSVHGEY